MPYANDPSTAAYASCGSFTGASSAIRAAAGRPSSYSDARTPTPATHFVNVRSGGGMHIIPAATPAHSKENYHPHGNVISGGGGRPSSFSDPHTSPGGGMHVVPTIAPDHLMPPQYRSYAGDALPDWAKLTMAIGIPVLAIGGTIGIVDALANETKAATPIAVAAINAQQGGTASQ